MNKLRRGLVGLHRWLGVGIALLVVLVGLTGALLPHQNLLRAWLAPAVWTVQAPAPGAAPLPGLELARRVEQATGGRVDHIPLAPKHGHASSFFVQPAAGGPPLGFNQVFVDPYSGDIRARVRFADLRDGAINLPPVIVAFHHSLAAGALGSRVLGAVALLWLLLTLAGVLLSLRPMGRGARRSRAQRLHRWLGLGVAPLVLVFAWSALAFNLPGLHSAAQRLLGAQGLYPPISNPMPMPGVPMAREQAVATGAALMAEEAARRGFSVQRGVALSWRPDTQLAGYHAHTSLDGDTTRPATTLWFDPVSGEALAFVPPDGATRADALDRAARRLHTASLGGLPYRLLVSLFGLATAVVALAGVWTWARRLRRRRPPA